MLFRWVILVLTAASLSLVVGRPVSLTNSVDDENEQDFVMLEGDNMTIFCAEDPDYPPAVLFAQDHDRDHYHVVFFGLKQIDNDDVWTAEDVGNGTIKYTLVDVNIENAADYVCNQPRQDHPNERIAVIGKAPSCNKDVDGETGETTELGHCKLDRKGDVALALELKVVDEAGAALEVSRIDGKRYVEAVFKATGGFTCTVEGLDEKLGVGSCQMPGAAPVVEVEVIEPEEEIPVSEEEEVKEETDEKVPEDENKVVVDDGLLIPDEVVDDEVVPPVEEEEEEVVAPVEEAEVVVPVEEVEDEVVSPVEEEEVVAPVEEAEVVVPVEEVEDEVVAPVEEEEVVAPVEEEEVVAPVEEEEVVAPVEEEEVVAPAEEEEVVAPVEEVEVAEPVEGVVEEEAVEKVDVEEVALEDASAEVDQEVEVEKEEVEEEVVEEAAVEEAVEEEPVEEDAVKEVSVEEESVEKTDE